MIGFFSYWSEAAQTTVELTSLVHPITIGGISALQCQVWNMEEEYIANIFRVVNGHTDQLTLRDKYDTDSSLGERGFLAKRTFSGGSQVLFLTVIDISPGDEGKYLCKVYSFTDGKFKDISEDSMTIEIYLFPDKVFPTCHIAPNKVIFNRDEQIILTCTSEKGFPVARLDWSCINDDIDFNILNYPMEIS